MVARNEKSDSTAKKKDRRGRPTRPKREADADADAEEKDRNGPGVEEGPPARRRLLLGDQAAPQPPLPRRLRLSRVVVVAGTYDGVLAGWEFHDDECDAEADENDEGDDDDDVEDNRRRVQLKVRFAAPVHNGSVRCLALNTSRSSVSPRAGAAAASIPSPGMLVSVGFDDVLRLHDFRRHQTGCGEVRTPSEWGTPIVAALAPPVSATHCLVGFVTGKILLYSTKDWSVQHVFPGHSPSSSTAAAAAASLPSASSACGVASLSVHPSGKLALSGGLNDGKLMLWDLTKGRLAHVNKINAAAAASSPSKRRYDPIACIVWGQCGEREMYGYCHGRHITVRDVATGRELLDVELPSKVHQICFLSATANEEGGSGAATSFVAAACDDGSLPVLAVDELDASIASVAAPVRRALMAIEPATTTDACGVHGAGEERFKCIHAVSPCHVVTANSAGVVSLMDLSGAIRMLLDPQDDIDDDEDSASNASDDIHPTNDNDDEDEEELAVDILDSVRLGTGARITCLTAWAAASFTGALPKVDKHRAESVELSKKVDPEQPERGHDSSAKRKRGEVEMDASALEKARKLVSKAKKIQKRKRDKTPKKEGQST